MFRRELSRTLQKRLSEQRSFIQVVMGPRQTGKTTAVQQAVKASGLPAHVASADDSGGLASEWIEMEWRQARSLASNGAKAILVLDEVQKIPHWSSKVKALWDEDTWNGTNLLVVITGSSSLLLKSGLDESLMGRFELIRSTHWGLSEMSEAFGYSLEDYLRFGGYPGAAVLRSDINRWRQYMHDSIIETTISRDVLQIEDIRKPALMRALFELGAQYSAQELSYRKILGQLDDRGNTDTIKHYLDLLSQAGMMSGLQKYDSKQTRSRASSPRLIVHDPSLMTALWTGPDDPFANPEIRGHLAETAVGARLIARSQTEGFNVYWWREGDREVDFVISEPLGTPTAIEVKSGRLSKSGLAEFCQANPKTKPIVVGSRNTSVEAFLRDEIALF